MSSLVSYSSCTVKKTRPRKQAGISEWMGIKKIKYRKSRVGCFGTPDTLCKNNILVDRGKYARIPSPILHHKHEHISHGHCHTLKNEDHQGDEGLIPSFVVFVFVFVFVHPPPPSNNRGGPSSPPDVAGVKATPCTLGLKPSLSYRPPCWCWSSWQR